MNSNEWDNDYRQSYTIAKSDLLTIRQLCKALADQFDITIKHTKPEMPFSSQTDKEKQFLQSMEYPKNYYNFQAFGVKICVHYIRGWSCQKFEIPRNDYYFVGIGGFIPENEKFKCVSPRIETNKMNFFNPTTEIEEAIIDFYYAVRAFLLSLGIGKFSQIDLQLNTKDMEDECSKHRNCFSCKFFNIEDGECTHLKNNQKNIVLEPMI